MELSEDLMKLHGINPGLGRRDVVGIELTPRVGRSPFLSLFAAGMINEDLPHDLGRCPVQVRRILPIGLPVECDKSFMDEGGRRQRVPAVFLTDVAKGDLLEFVIDLTKQVARGQAFAGRSPLNDVILF